MRNFFNLVAIFEDLRKLGIGLMLVGLIGLVIRDDISAISGGGAGGSWCYDMVLGYYQVGLIMGAGFYIVVGLLALFIGIIAFLAILQARKYGMTENR